MRVSFIIIKHCGAEEDTQNKINTTVNIILLMVCDMNLNEGKYVSAYRQSAYSSQLSSGPLLALQKSTQERATRIHGTRKNTALIQNVTSGSLEMNTQDGGSPLAMMLRTA